MIDFVARACAFFNGDFYWIQSQSTGLIAVAEPSSKPIFLAPDAPDALIGEGIRTALQASRKMGAAEFNKRWAAGEFSRIEEEREHEAISRFSYRNRKDLRRAMRLCWISLKENSLEIAPSRKVSIDGYTSDKESGPFPLLIASSASDAELGEAVRQGFSLCQVGKK